MNPSTVTINSVEIFVVLSSLGVLTAATVCLWVLYSNEKRRRLFEQDMQQRRLIQLERCVAMYRERDRLEEVVRRQREDIPAVTLPVTHCERRDRRRRFLPLEHDTDAT